MSARTWEKCEHLFQQFPKALINQIKNIIFNHSKNWLVNDMWDQSFWSCCHINVGKRQVAQCQTPWLLDHHDPEVQGQCEVSDTWTTWPTWPWGEWSVWSIRHLEHLIDHYGPEVDGQLEVSVILTTWSP